MFQKAKNLFPRKEKSQSYGFLHKFFYSAKKDETRSEEHTSELQSHSFISYAVFCLKKKKTNKTRKNIVDRKSFL